MWAKKMGNTKPYIIYAIILGMLVLGTAMQVVANQPPVANVVPEYQQVYVGDDAWFAANGSYDPDGYIVSYEWDFGDGTYGSGFYVEHSYNTSGSYVVWLTVTDDENATDTDYANVTVLDPTTGNEPPVADADPDHQTVDVGEEAWFYGGNSYDPDGYIVSYEWDFGDGSYGSGINVSHEYTSPGNYTVTLTVMDDDNETDTDTVTVTVLGPSINEPPVADADPDYQTVDAGEEAWFYGGNSYDPDGYIISYEWDFGDGSYGSGINVSHIYTSPGNYTVTLTVMDDDNATDTDTVTVTVLVPPLNEPPVADADPDFQTVEVGEEAWFYGGNSYDLDGYIVSYEWDFGDGNSGYGINVSHIYSSPGNYTVTLTVMDDENATDSDTCLVMVEEQLPSSPTELDAILAPGSLADVKLTWTASADDGAGDNDVDGYTVYRSITGIYGVYEFEAWIPAKKIPGHTYEWTDFGAGDGDWNNYFYIVRAKDIFGNEEQNNNKVGKFVSSLDEGWNLISVPLVQSDTTREVVLQTVEGNYASVYGYHAGKSRPWLHWHRDKPNKFNDVIEINHKGGYYIDMIVPDYLVTAGKVAEQVDINLKTGWNLVGYPCLTEQTVSDALSSIDGKYNIVEYYDTALDKEVRLGPNDYMLPGLGHWLHCTENCVWTVTN